MFVADASTTISWFLFNQSTGDSIRAEKLARTQLLVVPSLWWLETHNILLKKQRQQKLPKEDAREIVISLLMLPKRTDPEPLRENIEEILRLAELHMLTLYDATYLELALRLNLRLASEDSALRNAARRAGLKIV